MNITNNFTDADGNHEGGTSYGKGYCISWQRGESYRNGAFLLDVLGACQERLLYFQNSKFECPENDRALGHLYEAITALEARRDKRKAERTLGTQTKK